MKSPVFLFCYLFFAAAVGTAQNFSGSPSGPKFTGDLIFENLSYEDGLPGLGAHGITQDRQGFLWFATNNGLARYDGLNVKIYQHIPGDSTTLPASHIWDVEEDHEGLLWIPTHDGGLTYFDPRTEKFAKFPLFSRNGQPLGVAIWNVYEDSRHRLWLCTRGEGVLIIDADRDPESVRQFVSDPDDPESISDDQVINVYEDTQGRYWLSTARNGLNLFDPESGKAVRFLHDPEQPNSLALNFSVIKIIKDRFQKLWISTAGGLSSLDMQDTSFINYSHDPDNPNSLSNNGVWGLATDRQDRIWAATINGLNLYDTNSGKFSHFFNNPLNPYTPASDFSRDIFQDRTGIIWISTAEGITKYSPRNFTFISLINTLEEKKISNFDAGIHDILEDRPGNIWISTHINGLYKYEPATKKVSHFFSESQPPFQLPFGNIWHLEQDLEGRLLIGAGNGLAYYDPDRQEFQWYCAGAEEEHKKIRAGNGLDAFTMDHEGDIWMGSGGDLFKWDTENCKIAEHYTFDPDSPDGLQISLLTSIQIDQFGNFWLGGEGGGLQCFNPLTKQFTRPDLPMDLPAQLSPAHRPMYMVDSKGRVWISAGRQLIRFQPDRQGNATHVEAWKTKGGYIREDHLGRYWLVRPDGIARFDPELGKEQKEYSLKGITASLDGSMGVTRSGAILLGGYQGLYVFNPDEDYRNQEPPPIAFTDFKLFNRSVPIKGTSADTLDLPPILEQSIRFTRQVRLSHNLNDFTIEFVALDFHQPELNQYKHLLEGGSHKDTVFTTAERPFAIYNNLPPGNYTFRVWGSNSDGVWNDEGLSLNIIILSPWYWSTWSKALYLLIVGMVIYTFYRSQLRRRLAAAEARRLQELDTFKTHLYTNLTHEFRTPLTVISGMADQVLDNPKQWFREGLEMIKRNSRQVLGLVNQMLDLSKLESGHLPVSMIRDDIIRYLKYLTESLHSYAESKDIRLHLLPEAEALEMDFDPEKIQSIYTNLVGNAIKFTPAGGDVYVTVDGGRQTVDGDSLVLKVRDNGIGIPAAQLPHIFDRFYQADNSSTRVGEGTGIGLSLTRELVKLLGGHIEVKSREGAGTEFTVSLPLSREAEKGTAADLTANIPLPVSGNHSKDSLMAPVLSVSGELPLALLIEDNRDVLQYLAACLQGQYRLEMAANGREGVERALDLVPDIIISDVMMPEMDGFQVVDALKKDERTSHIPIILLTARADMDARLAGLERGADAYLAKPFEQRELEVVLRKLIELRRQLQARYGALGPVADAKEEAFSPEAAFLSRLRQYIEQHLEKEELSIHGICRELGVSRTQLHRKLTALTGKSTSQVIRQIRMQKARELLKDTGLNVSEVGYAVGYANPSHFTQEFTKEFGAAPSFYRNER